MYYVIIRQELIKTIKEIANMAFCSNCGKELAAGAKFCFECGTPVGKTDETVRRTVYSGEIHKCPVCGEVLQSMTAICPACGHEINSAKLASALKEFIDEINECDKIIANTPKKELPKKGWKSWKTGTRVFWVILNLFTSCIPLVIYLSFPLLKPFLKKNAMPELTSDEKHKVSLIENLALTDDDSEELTESYTTEDKVFILSLDEIMNTEYGFSNNFFSDEKRSRKVTDYAKANKADADDDNQCGDYWLRTPDEYEEYNMNCVTCSGHIICDYYIDYTIGVVPALRIKIK